LITQRRPIQILSPSVPQHLNPLAKPQPQRLFQPSEFLTRELLVDRLDLCRVSLLESLEDGKEERVEDVEDLVVVLLDGHFQIESGEFTQVACEAREER
jgi:hypothetical protein